VSYARAALQARLQSAPTGEKANLARAIAVLNEKLRDRQNDLVDCIAASTRDRHVGWLKVRLWWARRLDG
jgi:hypothetical protein